MAAQASRTNRAVQRTHCRCSVWSVSGRMPEAAAGATADEWQQATAVQQQMQATRLLGARPLQVRQACGMHTSCVQRVSCWCPDQADIFCAQSPTAAQQPQAVKWSSLLIGLRRALPRRDSEHSAAAAAWLEMRGAGSCAALPPVLP